jgi:putative acetyltransferase
MQTQTAIESEPRAWFPAEGVHIKRAGAQEPADALALIEEYYEAVDVVARDNRETLLRYLSNPDIGVWVAYRGFAPAGCIVYRPLEGRAESAEMKRLYVRPAYRGLGIAARLLETLERFAAGRNISWLYLDTKDDLHHAISFYERHGYERCARYNNNPQATIFMRKRLSTPIRIRSFRPGDEKAFWALNEAWIAKYFRLEDKDLETLRDPHTHILDPGGEIFIAEQNGERIGCCALLRIEDGGFEVAKMAVAESKRGRGIGRMLLEHAIDYARKRSVPRLYLETNSSLLNAIHIYESVGFKRLRAEQVKPSPYERADVYMEMMLK